MKDFVVFDIETTGRQPWSSVLVRSGIGDTTYGGPLAREKGHTLLRTPGVAVEHTPFDARYFMLDGGEMHEDFEMHDTRTLAWLDDAQQPRRLEDLMLRYFGEQIAKPIVSRDDAPYWSCAIVPLDDFGPKDLVPIDEVPDDVMDEYNLDDLEEEERLYLELRDRLVADDKWTLFERDEVPLAKLLLELEAAGLPFDEAARAVLRKEVAGKAEELRQELLDVVGAPLNLGSTKQLGAYLFGKKGARVEIKGSFRLSEVQQRVIASVNKDERLEYAQDFAPDNFEVRKVGRIIVSGVWVVKGRGCTPGEAKFGDSSQWKSGAKERATPSTSAVSLVVANPDDEWVAEFVQWKERDTLDNNFLQKFPNFVHDGRLYGTINRCGTVSGRFSSSEPNLQNFPAHGEFGPAVRALFVGDLVVGDYSQLEQRVAAHFSQDPTLLGAYENDEDIYGLAASLLFKGKSSKDHPQRGLMKTGLLALQYGAKAGKLAQLLEIDGFGKQTKSDAQKLIDHLQYRAFPRFFEWRNEVAKQAAWDGYVETISGRRRNLEFPKGWYRAKYGKGQEFSEYTRARSPEEALWQSKGFSVERQAVNTKCQGSAADVVSGALLAVRHEMPKAARVLVQVHDEAVWERLRGWRKTSLAELKELCEVGHGYEMLVRLTFAAQEAQSWAEKGVTATGFKHVFGERMKRERHEAVGFRRASDIARERRAKMEEQSRKAKKSRALGNGGRR